MSEYRILCFGTHILDTVARPVNELPVNQNSLRIEQILHAPGGTAAGVSVDIAHLGFDVTSVGVVGNDDTGRFLTSLMDQRGVNVDYLNVMEDAQTSSSVLLVDEAGNRPALHVRGVNAILTWDDVNTDSFGDATIAHFGGMDAMSGLDKQVTREHMLGMRERGATVTLDFQSSAAHLDSSLLTLVGAADVFIPNDEQAMGLSGCDTIEDAAQFFLDLGTTTVIITCGADGMYLVNASGTVLRQSAFETQVVDTTGCGDSVVATYLIAASLGYPDVDILKLAAASGAAVASGLGSLGNLPTWAELEARAGVTPKR